MFTRKEIENAVQKKNSYIRVLAVSCIDEHTNILKFTSNIHERFKWEPTYYIMRNQKFDWVGDSYMTGGFVPVAIVDPYIGGKYLLEREIKSEFGDIVFINFEEVV